MKIHIVKHGDTLYELAQKNGTDLQTLVAMNPQIGNPDKLEVGMKIKIPSATVPMKPVMNPGKMQEHIVVEGNTLWKLSKAWDIPLQAIKQANPQLKNPDALTVGEIVYIPVVGAQQPPQAMHLGKKSTAPIPAKTVPLLKPTAQYEPLTTPPPPVAELPTGLEQPAALHPFIEKENVDLFEQFKIPATEVGSFYDLPNMTTYSVMPQMEETKTSISYTKMHKPPKMLAPSIMPMPLSTQKPTPCPPQYVSQFTSMYPPQASAPFKAELQTPPMMGVPCLPTPHMQTMPTTSPYLDYMHGAQMNQWNPHTCCQETMGIPMSKVPYQNPMGTMMQAHVGNFSHPFMSAHAANCGCGGNRDERVQPELQMMGQAQHEHREETSGELEDKATIKQVERPIRQTKRAKSKKMKANIHGKQSEIKQTPRLNRGR